MHTFNKTSWSFLWNKSSITRPALIFIEIDAPVQLALFRFSKSVDILDCSLKGHGSIWKIASNGTSADILVSSLSMTSCHDSFQNVLWAGFFKSKFFSLSRLIFVRPSRKWGSENISRNEAQRYLHVARSKCVSSLTVFRRFFNFKNSLSFHVLVDIFPSFQKCFFVKSKTMNLRQSFFKRSEHSGAFIWTSVINIYSGSRTELCRYEFSENFLNRISLFRYGVFMKEPGLRWIVEEIFFYS